MKYISTILLLLTTSFAHAQTVVAPTSVPSIWIMLTEYNGEMVLFHPCNAEIQSISIYQKDEGVYSIIHGFGQDASEYPLKKVIKQSNGSFAFKLDGSADYILSFLDNDHKTASWIAGANGSTIFANADYKDEFPSVEQPCKECWSDDMCPEDKPEIVYTYKIEKINEVAQDKSLAAFVTRLEQAIKAKDKAYLLSVIDKDIKSSFGDDNGVEAFKKMWNLDKGDSPIWFTLGKLISLGGRFLDYEQGTREAKTAFVFPYTQAADNSNFPPDADPYTMMVVTGANVNLRDAPSRSSKVITMLTYDLVIPNLEKSLLAKGEFSDLRRYEWYYVTTLETKQSGYVYWDFLWSTIDYRMFLVKKNGQWRITTLLAGD